MQLGEEALLVLFIVFTRGFVFPAVKTVKKDDRVQGQEHCHRHTKAQSAKMVGGDVAECFPISQAVVFPLLFTYSLSVLYPKCLSKEQSSLRQCEYGK